MYWMVFYGSEVNEDVVSLLNQHYQSIQAPFFLFFIRLPLLTSLLIYILAFAPLALLVPPLCSWHSDIAHCLRDLPLPIHLVLLFSSLAIAASSPLTSCPPPLPHTHTHTPPPPNPLWYHDTYQHTTC